MKKILFTLVLIVVCAVLMLSGCKKTNETGYDEYFNNFASNPGFASVAESLVLDEGVYVNSYDSKANVYITYEKIKKNDDETVDIYGFATEDDVIMAPRYSYVLDVRYNYAIVVKQHIGNDNKVYYTVGAVCIRGDKVGKEYGFSYEYNSSALQYAFLNNDYLVTFGDKDSEGSDFDYATVYDYTSANGLLEVGRIGNTTLATTFSMYDTYIAAVGKSVVRYYYFDQIDQNGYFVQSEGGMFAPFIEEDGFEQIETQVATSVYYLGNGWFVETGVYSDSKQFTGYEQSKKVESGTTHYYVNRSTRFNVISGKRFDTDRVTLVANKYSSDYIKSMTNALNYEVSISESDQLPLYFQPIVPVSELIKDGYSLVYYDFDYYYNDELEWGQSFTIYDQNADIINLEDLIMPLLFVDGIGLQNSDPVYNIPGRELAYNKMDKTIVTLRAVENRFWYDPVILNDGMIIGYRANFNEGPEMLTSMMGAISADGQHEIPFEFVELTMFVNGYATGSKIVTSEETASREFYRISKSGVIVPLENVYCLKNGLYITNEGELYGLFASDGTRLLNAEYTGISIIETYLEDGLYFKSRIVGTKDGRGVIFRVTQNAH